MILVSIAIILNGPAVLIACVSPVLTTLRLWQLKEWRVDRITEHLHREGVLSQLSSPFRLGLLGLSTIILLIVAGFAPDRASIDLTWNGIVLGLPIVLAALTFLQFLLNRQPIPVWTIKAQLLFVVTLTLQGMVYLLVQIPLRSYGVFAFTAGPTLIPYLSPVFVFVAWLLLSPIDRTIKRRIIARAAALRRAHPKLTVIGVTGSVGKTTTKELLAHVLAPLGAIATPGHVNTDVGVARWLTEILSKKPVDESGIIVVEMGVYRAGEVTILCDICEPQIGVITHVGSQHLGLFGSREAIAEAKGELFACLPKNGRAFANRDNDLADLLIKRAQCPVTTVGTSHHPDLQALDIEETSTGLKFRVQGTLFEVPLIGTHNVTNILLAIAVASHLGMSTVDIAKRLRSFKAMPGTFEVRIAAGVTVLADTYNASPDSLAAAIDWASAQAHKRKFLLTSGIIELGLEERPIHIEMARKAAHIFERVIITDPHFLPYFRQSFGDNASDLTPSVQRVSSGDLLVCVGRMPQQVIDRLMPGSKTPQ